MYRIEIERSARKGQFFWRIRSSNGRILATSETYKRRPLNVVKVFAASFRKGTVEIVDKTG